MTDIVQKEKLKPAAVYLSVYILYNERYLICNKGEIQNHLLEIIIHEMFILRSQWRKRVKTVRI